MNEFSVTNIQEAQHHPPLVHCIWIAQLPQKALQLLAQITPRAPLEYLTISTRRERTCMKTSLKHPTRMQDLGPSVNAEHACWFHPSYEPPWLANIYSAGLNPGIASTRRTAVLQAVNPQPWSSQGQLRMSDKCWLVRGPHRAQNIKTKSLTFIGKLTRKSRSAVIFSPKLVCFFLFYITG